MKYVALVVCLLLAGCLETDCFFERSGSLGEHESIHTNWKLEYYSKITVNDQYLYNCVYVDCSSGRPATSFAILSNEKCKDRL